MKSRGKARLAGFNGSPWIATEGVSRDRWASVGRLAAAVEDPPQEIGADAESHRFAAKADADRVEREPCGGLQHLDDQLVLANRGHPAEPRLRAVAQHLDRLIESNDDIALQEEKRPLDRRRRAADAEFSPHGLAPRATRVRLDADKLL